MNCFPDFLRAIFPRLLSEIRCHLRKMLPHFAWITLVFCSVDVFGGPGLPPNIRATLSSRCLSCHDTQSMSGGVDLELMLNDFDAARDTAAWVKVEVALEAGRMPPPDEDRLTKQQKASFVDWFHGQFVMPGGIQHPGPFRARRLTREELQNTLEDILYVEIRQTVTNSRLHVIPDTIIEKFFSAGVVGASGFSNDAITLGQESIDIQTYARCFSLVLSLLDQNDAAREKLMGAALLSADFSAANARPFLTSFARSAWRRQPLETEVDALCRAYREVAEHEDPLKAMKASFLAVLMSPSFLFRLEDDPGTEIGDESDLIVPLSSRELAVRLSYFLWSSPPDDELWECVSNDSLQNDAVLRQQVKRMLADPRRIALAENLGGEWFDYRQLRQQSAVNKRSDRMAGFYRTQYEEALLFFDSILRYRQSLFKLVDADWAFLNPHQRGIYKLTAKPHSFNDSDSLPPINLHYRDANREIQTRNYEYKHAPLTAMKLQDPDRGGFVTLGSTLSVTSSANRTSPIRRGVWVTERILGKHFEVPEDVPDLEESRSKARTQDKPLSDTELLKLHSSQPGCAACHQYIDPVGFGLEGFDQLGIRRATTQSSPEGEKLHWSPSETPRNYADVTWQLEEPLEPGSETRVFFEYLKGRHRLNIRNVRLTNDNLTLVDKHFGFTGEAKRDNIWFFNIPETATAESWTLTAEVEGDGGTDSSGVVTIAGPDAARPGYELPNGAQFHSPAELKRLLLSDYREQIVDNAIERVLGYALGRKVLPVDRPAIAAIRKMISEDDYRLTSLVEAVALSFPFRHKESQ